MKSQAEGLLLLLRFPAQQDQRDNHHQRKNTACQHAGLQVIPCLLGYSPDQARPEGPAQVAGHGQHCEKRRPALWNSGGCDADRTRPHDAHRETAEHTADESRNRTGRQARQQIAAQAQYS